MNQDINSIIDQLAEIDSASAKIMQKTQVEKSKYADYITQQKQTFDASLQSEIDKAVEEFKISIDSETKEQIKLYTLNCDEDIAKLNKSFDDNASKWADAIFNNIIKG